MIGMSGRRRRMRLAIGCVNSGLSMMTTASGSAAMHAAIAALQLAPGDEVTVDYRTVARVLDRPFSLWYRDRPYSGESTSGAGRVKTAMFGDLGDALQATVLNPILTNMSVNRGMVFAPGKGDLVDRMDKLREQQEAFQASADAAQA